MNRTLTLLLLLAVVSTLVVGCASKSDAAMTGADKINNLPQEQDMPNQKVTSDAVVDDATSGWVDENQDVEIGEMV